MEEGRKRWRKTGRERGKEGRRIAYLSIPRVAVDTQEWVSQRSPARFDPKNSIQATSVKPLPGNGSAGGWAVH